ncbi:MAG: hypothetical protein ACLFTG_16200 [Alphaproteobacteria bacterium]
MIVLWEASDRICGKRLKALRSVLLRRTTGRTALRFVPSFANETRIRSKDDAILADRRKPLVESGRHGMPSATCRAEARRPAALTGPTGRLHGRLAGVRGVRVWIDQTVMPLIAMAYQVENAIETWRATNLPRAVGAATG